MEEGDRTNEKSPSNPTWHIYYYYYYYPLRTYIPSNILDSTAGPTIHYYTATTTLLSAQCQYVGLLLVSFRIYLEKRLFIRLFIILLQVANVPFDGMEEIQVAKLDDLHFSCNNRTLDMIKID